MASQLIPLYARAAGPSVARLKNARTNADYVVPTGKIGTILSARFTNRTATAQGGGAGSSTAFDFFMWDGNLSSMTTALYLAPGRAVRPTCSEIVNGGEIKDPIPEGFYLGIYATVASSLDVIVEVSEDDPND